MPRLRRLLRSALWNCASAALVAQAGAASIGTPVLEWQRCPPAYCETGWYASPAVTDVDRDGVVDVLWGGYTLLAVRGDTGAIQWSYKAPLGGRMWPGVAVADLDDDGTSEIVVVQYDWIGVLGASGAPRLGWPQQVFGGSEMRRLMPRPVTDFAAAFGVLLYVGVGVYSLLQGYTFLDYAAINPANPGGAEPWGMTLVEYGVGITVSSVMVTIFNKITDQRRDGDGGDV